MEDALEFIFEIIGEIVKFIFELLYEIIVECIFELLALKNVAWPVRIIIWLILVLIFSAIIIAL